MDRVRLLIRDAKTLAIELVALEINPEDHDWITFEKRHSRIAHRNGVSIHECSEIAKSCYSRRTAPDVLIDLTFTALYNRFIETTGENNTRQNREDDEP